MGLFDELKKLTNPYDSEENDFIDEAESNKQEPAAQRRPGPFSGFSGSQGSSARASSGAATVTSSPASATARQASAARGTKRDGRVVSIAGGSDPQPQQMILVKPVTFGDARTIAGHLRDMRPVVLNLETTPEDVSRRLLDFLSGVAYAQESSIEKIATKTYLITPYGVDLSGDFITGDFAGSLESGGAYL